MIKLKELFIDRKSYLSDMTEGLKSGKDYILIAPRRYGKTTLAQKVLDKISQDKSFLVIQVDFMRYSNSVESIAEAIIENCLNALGFMGRLKLWLNQVDFSLKLKVKYSDLEIEPILQLIKLKQDPDVLLEHALNLIENIAVKTNKTVIMFFDEFGELQKIGEQVIRTFRSVLQTHKLVNYLFAGSQETLMEKIFMDKEGAFYRFGELVFVKEFDREEVIEILSVEMKLSFDVIEAILNLFKCHPYYTSRIIKDIKVLPKIASSLDTFMEYISASLIPSEMAYIELQRDILSKKAYALDIIISLSMNQELNTLDAPRQSIHRTLKSLEISGFIVRDANGKYIVADPLINLYFNN